MLASGRGCTRCLALFRTALDYWCRADYAYGIQAVYANIGTVYAQWGDHLRTYRLADRAPHRYRQVVEWLQRCLDFSGQARVGEDTSEAQRVLAEVYYELGEFDHPWTMAREAQEAVQKAGNELDLARATLTLGKLHATTGDREHARGLMTDAMTHYEPLGHLERAAAIRRKLPRESQ
jgi:tetratricopeptide (TPR) repeat protein